MDNGRIEEIKKIVEEFFQKTTFAVEVEILNIQNSVIPVRIKAEEPKFLIGENGHILAATQHLLKAVLRRKIKENFYLDLDIDDYKSKKTEYLRELARSIADEVALTKKEKTLEPMAAYERRIIHLELSQRSDVVTKSVGEGEERKIVVSSRPI